MAALKALERRWTLGMVGRIRSGARIGVGLGQTADDPDAPGGGHRSPGMSAAVGWGMPGVATVKALLLGMALFPLGAQEVRVGVLGLFRPQELVLKPKTAVVVRAGTERITVYPGQAIGLRVAGTQVDCFVERRSIAGWLVTVDGGEFTLGVPGKIQRAYRGVLEVRPAAGMLEAVVRMERERAVAAAVAAESKPGTRLEGLKAQAVVTRSYYMASPRRHENFDYCDTTHCQFLREAPGVDSDAAQAVGETAGQYLTWQGAPLAAVYSASCGGKTRTAAEAGWRAGGYPYFAVECEACRRNARQWESDLPLPAAQALIDGDRTEAMRLELGRRFGWARIPGANFVVEGGERGVHLKGRGEGHGVGLCQLGAAGMAEAGASFRGILEVYLPHAALAR